MTELKSLESLGASPAGGEVKEKFIGDTGVVKKANKRFQSRTLADPAGRYSKILLYGDIGSGKNFALADLLEAGEKIFAVGTDVGGDGITPTVTPELIRRGRADLLSNIRVQIFDNHDDFELFTVKPTEIYPEIYDDGFTMLHWDGMTNWQLNHIPNYIENNFPNLVEEANTLRYWGEVRDITIATVNRFLYMKNRKTGQLWHKYVTALETQEASAEMLANTPDQKERLKLQRPIKAPYIQGSAARLVPAAFDIVLRCVAKNVKDDKGVRAIKYLYQTATHEKLKVKVRGIKFNAEEPAEFGRLWSTIREQMGLVQ